MSDSSQSSKASNVFFAAGILLSFGFLGLILTSNAKKGSLEENAYRGEFDEATTEMRWKNLEEIESAQADIVDEAKLSQAMASVSGTAVAPAASGVVVPGSPTFMKQMEEAAKKEEEAAKAKEEAAKKESSDGAGAKPEPKTESKPAPQPNAEKAEPKKAEPSEAAKPEQPEPKKASEE